MGFPECVARAKELVASWPSLPRIHPEFAQRSLADCNLSVASAQENQVSFLSHEAAAAGRAEAEATSFLWELRRFKASESREAQAQGRHSEWECQCQHIRFRNRHFLRSRMRCTALRRTYRASAAAHDLKIR